MGTLDAYIPMDRRQALARGGELSDRTEGAVLFADISGFTPFHYALFKELGPQISAEELTRHLNRVYSVLIAVVHSYQGSVISFGGDAITCWFDGDNGRRTTACALEMQKVMDQLEQLSTPAGNNYPLGIKIAVASGRARRFLVGQPRIQRMEVLAGEILDRMAAAQKQLHAGEVVIGSEVMGRLGNQAIVKEWRKDEFDEHFAVVTGLTDPIPPKGWPEILPLDPEIARDWLLPAVYKRLIRGEGEFLAELRSAVAIFLSFQGINYDQDEKADIKLDTYISWVQTIMNKYEGILLEIIMGDKGSHLFSAFGARVTHENDVDRALAAVMEILTPPDELSFIHSIQVGITRGKVRVGAYGSPTRRTYAAQGTEVTIASRLMGKASPGQVLLSARIKEDASNRFEFEELEPTFLKGFSEPFQMFALVHKPPEMKTDILGRSIYPIVGREAETAAITQGLQALKKGKSKTFIIEGEAGIGKTRLVEYALMESRRSGITALIGAGDDIGKSSLYYAWRPIFKQLFQLDKVLDKQETNSRKKMQSDIIDHLSKLKPDMVCLAPLLNAVLPVDIPENELTRQMMSEVRADNIRELLVELLSETAKTTPLILVLEDVHWLDSPSWAMVRMVEREVQPLMLVITKRSLTESVTPEYSELLNEPHTHLMQLESFNPNNIETLIRNRLEIKKVAQSVLEFVFEEAEGNPFISEELIYAMRDQGLIKIVGDECQVTSKSGELRTLDFPDTIQDVIRSRIDRLEPQEQTALKVASAIGRTFSYRILNEVHYVEVDKPFLLEYLGTLERKAFTRIESREPDLTYKFEHAITQEVAYNLMLHTQRRKLHKTIAEWYESTYVDDLDQVYALLAHHWKKAEDDNKAVEFLGLAGEQAVKNFANKEAVTYLTEALAQVDEAGLAIDHLTRANWELLLGEAYVNLADYFEGQNHIEAGLALLGQPVPGKRIKQFLSVLGEVGLQLMHRSFPDFFVGRESDQREILESASRACERLVEVYFMTKETTLSLYTAFRTLNLAEKAGPSPELSRGYGTVGALIGFIPFHSAAANYLQRAMDTVDEVQDLNARVWVNIVTAFYFIGIGDWEEARCLLEEVIEISNRLGDQRRREDGLGVLCALNYFRGDFKSSLGYGEELIRLARRRGADHSLAFGLQGSSYAYYYMGQFDNALAYLEELRLMLTEDSRISDDALVIEMYGLLSMTYFRVNNLEKSLEMAEHCTDLSARISPSNFSSFSGYAGPAYTYISLWEVESSFSKVVHLTKKSLKLMKRYARVFPIGRPRTWLYEGKLQRLLGKPEKAIKIYQKSLKLAEDLDMCYEQGLAHLAIGESLPVVNSDRSVHLSRALDIFTGVESEFDRNCAEAALSKK